MDQFSIQVPMLYFPPGPRFKHHPPDTQDKNKTGVSLLMILIRNLWQKMHNFCLGNVNVNWRFAVGRIGDKAIRILTTVVVARLSEHCWEVCRTQSLSSQFQIVFFLPNCTTRCVSQVGVITHCLTLLCFLCSLLRKHIVFQTRKHLGIWGNLCMGICFIVGEWGSAADHRKAFTLCGFSSSSTSTVWCLCQLGPVS